MSLQFHNTLLWAILAGAVAGIVSGWFFGEAMLAFEWLGTLFLNALKMTIVPLIIAAVISEPNSAENFSTRLLSLSF